MADFFNGQVAHGGLYMALDLTLLYRGPLSSCNYRCNYCPFAKHHETAEELRQDREALERFYRWVKAREEDQFSILFTPWGEGLTRRWYQDALRQLSHLKQIRKVAIQTNLSASLDWIGGCDRKKLALWCTYHPTQTELRDFLAQCKRLDSAEVRYSVGIVGLKENLSEARMLRHELHPSVYLWINAYKDQDAYYTEQDIVEWQQIDPFFRFNNVRHASLGRACRAGETAVSIDGSGNVYRCHFIKEPLGNLYEDDIASLLQPRMCTKPTCGCYIGYIHLYHLRMYELFGSGVLERIPDSTEWQRHVAIPGSVVFQTSPSTKSFPILNIVKG